jgi:hypothetical protein
MQLGQLTRVAVEGTDLTLLVRVKWVEYKRMVRKIAALSEPEALPAMDAFLRSVIAGASGLIDADGKPAEWQPDLLDELAPGVVLAMFQACLQIGEAGSGDPLPATASEATSDA